MTVEVAVLISIVSFVLALFQTVANLRRSNKDETEKDASQLTTVIVKLENIGNDINEIKTDLRDMKDDLKDHNSRIVRLEQQVKTITGKE